MKDYDVIVIGGGISGSMAAIASARNGAKTLLIEQYGFLGGMLTAAGVGPMMTFHAGETQIIQGVTGELIDRLKKKGKSPGHIFDTTGYTYTVTPFDLEGMKRELELMVTESGADILYHTMLAKVDSADGVIDKIIICNKAGLSTIKAPVYVDATGDADLSKWAGVSCVKGRPRDGACQPMTMKLRFTNVDMEKIKGYIRDNPTEFPGTKGDTSIIDRSERLSIGGFTGIFNEARKRGEITFERQSILMFEANTPGEVIINTTRVLGLDATDPWQLSRGEIEGRRQAEELAMLIKTKVPGFENAYLNYTGPFIGIRSSRQIKGVYTLTADDVLNGTSFDDVIAHSGYPIDIHSPDGDKTNTKKLKWGAYCSIPYRCLINNEINNLITVGRSISADFEAQAAIRVTPITGAIGHAGGAAASILAKEGIRTDSVNIKRLQDTLLEQNAFLNLG